MTSRLLLLLWGTVAAVSLAGCKPRDAGNDGAAAAEASRNRQKALDALGKQDWDTAISLATEAIRLEPKNVDGFWIRGLASLKKKEHAKAEADCTEAIKLDANYAPAYRERGLALLGLKKYPEAIEDFTTYVRFSPEDPEGYQFRALAHSRKGDNAAASADLREADRLKGKKK